MKNWKMWAGYGCMVVGGALSGSGWCRDYDGHYHNIMGIGPDHADDQGNYYL